MEYGGGKAVGAGATGGGEGEEAIIPSVLTYALRRILLFIPTLLGISIVVFLSSALAPGDRCVGKLGERASAVEMIRCQLRQVEAERRSSRTGYSHTIGGFVGEAYYEGDLSEFLPYLEAAQWTGVGRHCVWGNGELRVDTIDPL